MEVQDHQGGEMYYQQSYTDSQLPQGFTTSLPEAIALAPDTIVVEHYPAPVVVQEQYESWGHQQEQTEVSWSAGLGINIPVMSEGNFTDTFDNNTPTYSATYTSPSPQVAGGPLSPTGQTQFINLGGLSADMSSLQIHGRRKEKSEEDRLVEREEQRKREEFKKKVLF